MVLDEAKIGVASMLGSRVRVKTRSWGFADDKQKSAGVVLLWLVNRWYTAVGYWQWHQQNGTNPLCDGA